jgi:predicted ester cyclase
MALRTPAELIRLWFEEVWNRRDADRIAEYLAPDGVIHATDEEGGDTHGPQQFRAFHQRMLAAFPDIHFTVVEVLADDRMAAARWTARLTHCGIGMGEPTGAAITLSGMSMLRVENGMGVEGWNEWDRLRLALACRRVVPAAA